MNYYIYFLQILVVGRALATVSPLQPSAVEAACVGVDDKDSSSMLQTRFDHSGRSPKDPHQEPQMGNTKERTKVSSILASMIDKARNSSRKQAGQWLQLSPTEDAAAALVLLAEQVSEGEGESIALLSKDVDPDAMNAEDVDSRALLAQDIQTLGKRRRRTRRRRRRRSRRRNKINNYFGGGGGGCLFQGYSHEDLRGHWRIQASSNGNCRETSEDISSAVAVATSGCQIIIYKDTACSIGAHTIADAEHSTSPRVWMNVQLNDPADGMNYDNLIRSTKCTCAD